MPQIAFADDWIVISVSSTGSKWMVKESDSVNKVNYYPTIWTKTDHSNDATVNHRTTMRRYTIDCAGDAVKLLAFVGYAANGSVVASESIPSYQQKYEPVVPDSVMADVEMIVCP